MENIKTSKKDLLFLALLLTCIFGFWFWGYIRQEKRVDIVMKYGNYYFGRVTKLSPVGNAGGNHVHYYFLNKGKTKKTFTLINKPYWLSLEVDDTILIKAIISDTLEQLVVIEDQNYIDLIPCLKVYKQPADGFSKLPVNKCD
ncbi:MAG: hypothetical protein COA32_10250 [Fluviicola sp.]|nr:MAG: hypothetical protein COA32_10250 [Fluviicola sp.]